MPMINGMFYSDKDMQDIAYASPEGQGQRQRAQFNRDRSMMGQYWKPRGQYAQGKGAFGNIPNIPNIPNIGEGLSGTDRNWPSIPGDQRKYNLQAAIRQNQQGTQGSYADKALDFQFGTSQLGTAPSWSKTSRISDEEKAIKGLGGNWWDDAAAGLGKLGASDYGKLFLGAGKTYMSYQANERAKEQHKLARKTLDFQQAAYKEQTGYQKTGINNQLRMQKALLESDFYADPGRAKSLQLLV